MLTSGRRITDAHCGIATKHLLMCDSIESLRRACKWPRTSTPLMNINGASLVTGKGRRSNLNISSVRRTTNVGLSETCFFVADSSWQIALPAVIKRLLYTIVLARTDSADSPDCLPTLLSNSVFYLSVLLSTKGRWFDSRAFHFQVTTFGKLFTHRAVQFGTGQGAVMPCGWEGNRRSGVALVMRHRLQWWSQSLS